MKELPRVLSVSLCSDFHAPTVSPQLLGESSCKEVYGAGFDAGNLSADSGTLFFIVLMGKSVNFSFKSQIRHLRNDNTKTVK